VEISPATVTMSEMCIDKRTGRKSARYGELQEAERQRKRLRQLKREQEATGTQNTPAPTDPISTMTTGDILPSTAEDDDALIPVTSGTAQMMTDSEGNIVLDRTSLRVDLHAVHPSTLTDSLIHTTETVFSSKTNSSTYPSTRRHASNTIRWLPADNERFYTALQMFGTDFGVVADYLGGGKTRRHVKNKFDREEKKDPGRLTWALKNRVEPDIPGLEEIRGRKMRGMDDLELRETLAGIREEARLIMALPRLSESQGDGVEKTSILD
jgi:transcription factor TFIIIB component B''